MSKRLLQAILLIPVLIALITGISGLADGILDAFFSISINTNLPGNLVLDSCFRYFSGLWLGVGISLLCIMPKIEIHVLPLRLICLMIFLGGIGRMISLIIVGKPPYILFFLQYLNYYPHC